MDKGREIEEQRDQKKDLRKRSLVVTRNEEGLRPFIIYHHTYHRHILHRNNLCRILSTKRDVG